MKLQTLLPILLLTWCSNLPSYAQKNKSTSTANTVGISIDESGTKADLANMLQAVDKTSSPSQKADLYFLISKYYAYWLKIDSALFYSERIREMSSNAAYELGIAKYYLAKAYALFYRSVRETENLNKSIEIFAKYKENDFLGFAYRLKGRQCRLARELPEARKHIHKAIPLYTQPGQVRSLQLAYHELSGCFSPNVETDSVAFYLISSLRLAERSMDSVQIYLTSSALGELYYFSGDNENAIKYIEYSINYRKPGYSKIMVRNDLAAYANCLLKLGDFTRARKIIEEYENINEKVGDSWGVLMLNNLKGKYDFFTQNYTGAFNHLETAFRGMYKANPVSVEIKNIAFHLGMTEFYMEKYDSAIRHLSLAMELVDQVKLGAAYVDGYLFLAKSFEGKGRNDSALYYMKYYDRMKDSLFTQQKARTVIELTTRYETEKKEQQIILLERESKLNAYGLKVSADQIEKQKLVDAQKSQQLALLTQQNKISQLESSEKALALENQQKEIAKKRNELALLSKENELQAAIAKQESQQKKFAYMAIAAILIFSAYILYRYSRNRKLSRQLAQSLSELKEAQQRLIKIEKEKEVENIRVNISRDIHDEVGSTLSGVALFSEIATEKVKQQQSLEAQRYLDYITTNSKEMVEKMSDIVWTINPKNDSFEKIIAKLRTYSANLCAGKGIRMHVEMDESIQSYSPSMQDRKNMYMLIKEGVNNAVKYSGGKNVYLSLYRNDEELNIEIKDDGRGFDPASNYEGNGINNMQERARELRGDLKIESGANKGTHIHLRCQFHPAGGVIKAE